MEPYHYKKRIFECVIRLYDSTVVYAGLDDTGNERVTFFLHLLHSSTDLPGTVNDTGNYDKVFGSDGMDSSTLFVRNCFMGKGKEKIGGAGRLKK